MDNATLQSVFPCIDGLLAEKESVCIAIDGRCGSGKSTLAELLRNKYACNIIHMDDFFLRPEQRTESRIATPGENIDHERFLKEVLQPLKKALPFSYRAFDCSRMQLGEEVRLEPKALTVVEGSYSLHPLLRNYYDLKIFLTVNAEEQMRRIVCRNGEAYAKVFKSRWIPLEEKYFSCCSVIDSCDFVLEA